MTLSFDPRDPLVDAVPASPLFGAWVSGRLAAGFLPPERQAAVRELDLALGGRPHGADGAANPGPLFRSPWVDGWAAGMAGDLPGEEDRSLFDSNLELLRSGRASVVVTGQQPGFLGGPLYTLYKVATAVAVAGARTRDGHPTVPVFWSGDDDDDMAEALAPAAWAPRTGDLVRGSGIAPAQGPSRRAKMIGRQGGDPWTAEGARWLETVSGAAGNGTGSLARDLAGIWRRAVLEHWNWSRLARCSLLRVFAGSGLVVVSGDDPGLHRAAAPLYERILGEAKILEEMVRQRGAELTALGWHAQINARSLARPLFQVENDRRKILETGTGQVDFGLLRPGVMLRSPVQDWLLQPAAVVAGPGELAYLRQLDPVYSRLGIERPPLVPRLFGWLLPAGFPAGGLREFREQRLEDPGLASRLAEQAEREAARILEGILTRDVGLSGERAASLAAGRARRWRRGVAALLNDEIRRSRRARAPQGPAWLFPDGARQERRLAYLCAAALWGDELVRACVEAASVHIRFGAANDWREFTCTVPDPNAAKDG